MSSGNSPTSPIELATAKLFAAFIRQLQPQMKNGNIHVMKLIEAAKALSRDEEKLASLYQDICKHYNTKKTLPQEELFRHRRVFHFRRLVIHYFMAISDGKQEVDHPISRHWLLQWYSVLEIALGKDFFIRPHELCTELVNDLKQNPEFAYNDFLIHPKAMLEYAVLMTRLAVFIETSPKKRIEWLVKAMASNPNTHAVNGMRVHTDDTPPPAFRQIKELVLGVFAHILRYIEKNNLEAEIQSRIAATKYPPTEMFDRLLIDIESLAHDV